MIPILTQLVSNVTVKVVRILFYLKGFAYKLRRVMSSGGKNFSLVKTNEMVGFEGVLNYCRFVKALVISVCNVFFDMRLNGPTRLPNIGFATRVRYLVDPLR